MAVACSPVDRMCVTPKPAIATLFMAGHSKQIALGCSTNQNVVVSKRNRHKHEPAPLFLYNLHTITKR